jgi:hypothetical protein
LNLATNNVHAGTITETISGEFTQSFYDTLGAFGAPREINPGETFSITAISTVSDPQLVSNTAPFIITPASTQIFIDGIVTVTSSPYFNYEIQNIQVKFPTPTEAFWISHLNDNLCDTCRSFEFDVDMFQIVPYGKLTRDGYELPSDIIFNTSDSYLLVNETSPYFGYQVGKVTSATLSSTVQFYAGVPEPATWGVSLIGMAFIGAWFRVRLHTRRSIGGPIGDSRLT